MAYTTRELITDAYYLSGIVSRNFQTVTGEEINDGLSRLNFFLQDKGSDIELIPYYSEVQGNFIVGQEKYFIPNLVKIDTLAYYLTNPNDTASVRMQMEEFSRYQYFETPRVEHVNTLPMWYHLERALGGSNLYIYFPPVLAYAYTLTGKYSLQSTDLNQDLSQVYDGWTMNYLQYGLACYLCEWRQVAPPISVEMNFKKLESKMRGLGHIDTTFRKTSFFNQGGGLNWGDVNYGKLWRPTP